MNRENLIIRIKILNQQIEEIFQEKAAELEKEQKNKSDLYRWSREQMLLIHQMKYQFSQDVMQIHRDSVKICQQSRVEIERLRATEYLDHPARTHQA